MRLVGNGIGLNRVTASARSSSDGKSSISATSPGFTCNVVAGRSEFDLGESDGDPVPPQRFRATFNVAVSAVDIRRFTNIDATFFFDPETLRLDHIDSGVDWPRAAALIGNDTIGVHPGQASIAAVIPEACDGRCHLFTLTFTVLASEDAIARISGRLNAPLISGEPLPRGNGDFVAGDIRIKLGGGGAVDDPPAPMPPETPRGCSAVPCVSCVGGRPKGDADGDCLFTIADVTFAQEVSFGNFFSGTGDGFPTTASVLPSQASALNLDSDDTIAGLRDIFTLLRARQLLVPFVHTLGGVQLEDDFPQVGEDATLGNVSQSNSTNGTAGLQSKSAECPPVLIEAELSTGAGLPLPPTYSSVYFDVKSILPALQGVIESAEVDVGSSSVVAGPMFGGLIRASPGKGLKWTVKVRTNASLSGVGLSLFALTFASSGASATSASRVLRVIDFVGGSDGPDGLYSTGDDNVVLLDGTRVTLSGDRGYGPFTRINGSDTMACSSLIPSTTGTSTGTTSPMTTQTSSRTSTATTSSTVTPSSTATTTPTAWPGCKPWETEIPRTTPASARTCREVNFNFSSAIVLQGSVSATAGYIFTTPRLSRAIDTGNTSRVSAPLFAATGFSDARYTVGAPPLQQAVTSKLGSARLDPDMLWGVLVSPRAWSDSRDEVRVQLQLRSQETFSTTTNDRDVVITATPLDKLADIGAGRISATARCPNRPNGICDIALPSLRPEWFVPAAPSSGAVAVSCSFVTPDVSEDIDIGIITTHADLVVGQHADSIMAVLPRKDLFVGEVFTVPVTSNFAYDLKVFELTFDVAPGLEIVGHTITKDSTGSDVWSGTLGINVNKRSASSSFFRKADTSTVIRPSPSGETLITIVVRVASVASVPASLGVELKIDTLRDGKSAQVQSDATAVVIHRDAVSDVGRGDIHIADGAEVRGIFVISSGVTELLNIAPLGGGTERTSLKVVGVTRLGVLTELTASASCVSSDASVIDVVGCGVELSADQTRGSRQAAVLVDVGSACAGKCARQVPFRVHYPVSVVMNVSQEVIRPVAGWYNESDARCETLMYAPSSVSVMATFSDTDDQAISGFEADVTSIAADSIIAEGSGALEISRTGELTATKPGLVTLSMRSVSATATVIVSSEPQLTVGLDIVALTAITGITPSEPSPFNRFTRTSVEYNLEPPNLRYEGDETRLVASAVFEDGSRLPLYYSTGLNFTSNNEDAILVADPETHLLRVPLSPTGGSGRLISAAWQPNVLCRSLVTGDGSTTPGAPLARADVSLEVIPPAAEAMIVSPATEARLVAKESVSEAAGYATTVQISVSLRFPGGRVQSGLERDPRVSYAIEGISGPGKCSGLSCTGLIIVSPSGLVSALPSRTGLDGIAMVTVSFEGQNVTASVTVSVASVFTLTTEARPEPDYSGAEWSLDSLCGYSYTVHMLICTCTLSFPVSHNEPTPLSRPFISVFTQTRADTRPLFPCRHFESAAPIACTTPPRYEMAKLRVSITLTDRRSKVLDTGVSYRALTADLENPSSAATISASGVVTPSSAGMVALVGSFAGISSPALVIAVSSAPVEVEELLRMRMIPTTTLTGVKGQGKAQVQLGGRFSNGRIFNSLVSATGSPALPGLITFTSTLESAAFIGEATGTVTLRDNHHSQIIATASACTTTEDEFVRADLEFSANLGAGYAGDVDLGGTSGPPVKAAAIGVPFEVAVAINTGGKTIGSYDIYLRFDPSALEGVDVVNAIRDSAGKVELGKNIGKGQIQFAGTVADSKVRGGRYQLATVTMKPLKTGVVRLTGFVKDLATNDVPGLLSLFPACSVSP